MREWGFWEWLTYGCIFVAAIMLATDAAIKGAPNMMRGLAGLLSSPVWNFLPLTLISASAILILATHLGWVGKVSVVPPPHAPYATTAEIQFHTYGDERVPTRILANGVWRWYFLRTIFRVPDTKTGQIVDAGEGTTLFITFDPPVSANTVEVSSPDFKMPQYEVKDFNNRSAIIAFTTRLPSGTLVVNIHP